jgi:hypothetical protein
VNTKQLRRAIVAMVVCAASAARAQSAAPPVQDGKSPSQAVLMPIVFTGVSLASFAAGRSKGNLPLLLVGSAGLVLAPSTGRWYANDVDGIGLGIRVGAAAVMTLAVADGGLYRDGERDAGKPTEKVSLGVATAMLAGTVYSIATSPRAADQHNPRVRARAAVTLIPLVSPTDAGLGLAAAF